MPQKAVVWGQTREMDQLLIVLAALPKDLGLILGTPNHRKPQFQESDNFWPPQTTGTHVLHRHVWRQNTHTIKFK